MAVKANKRLRRKEKAELLAAEENFGDNSTVQPEPSSSSQSALNIYQMPLPNSAATAAMRIPRRILICSIGNPGSLLSTRHSVGHYILQLLASGSFYRDAQYGGMVAQGPYSDSYKVTLFQSPSMMNVSGKAVKKAWNEFQKSAPTPTPVAEDKGKSGGGPLLVVLHDELEKSLGQVKLKKSGSTGGHNGLSSVADSLSTKDFVRIGLGIGRPESRDPRDVSNYVLTKLSGREKEVLEERSLPLVMGMIENLGKG